MIACIRLPYFALMIHSRDNVIDQTGPILIVRYKGGHGRVLGMSADAEAAGVQVGMAVNRARALCPDAGITLFAPGRVRTVVESLLAALTRYSQWVEAERDSIQTAILYTDLGKLKPSDGRAIAEQIITQFQAMGFAASVGLASGKFTAMVAANVTPVGAIKLVGRGDESRFLAPYPTTNLPLDTETRRRLDLLGLRRMGQLAILSRSALLAQFGKLGGRLHRLASGEDLRRIARYNPPVIECAARQFEPALDNRLLLESVLGTLSTGLMGKLSDQGLSCREVTLTLRLENRVETEIQRRPRKPISNQATLVRILRGLLDQVTLNAGIIEVEVQLSKLTPTLPRQLGLFDSLEAQDPRETLLDLSERYGENYFYSVNENPLHPLLPEMRFILEKVEAA